MSTIKVDTINTRTGSGDITFSRPIVADISSVTGTLPMARLSGTLPALNGSALTALNATQLTSGTIPIARIADDAVTTAKIAPDAITAAKIADGVINSEHYAAASIDNEHLADDAVGVAELSATGTASNTTFLRGDNAWATPSAGTSLSGTTNNTITTVTGANAVQGETNLQFDGNTFSVKGSGTTPTYSMTNNGEGIHLRWNDDSGARKSDIVAIGNTPAGATTTLRFWTNANGTDAATEKLRIDGAGRVTMPLQPFVELKHNGTESNVTGNGTTYTIAWDTETFDVGSNYVGSGSNSFTAPVAGHYLVSASIYLGGITSSADTIQYNVTFTNRTYNAWTENVNDLDSNRSVVLSVIGQMDTGDTITQTCRVNGCGSDVVDFLPSSGGQSWFTVTLLN